MKRKLPNLPLKHRKIALILLTSVIITAIIVLSLSFYYKSTSVSNIRFKSPSGHNYASRYINKSNPLIQNFNWSGGKISYIDILMSTYGKKLDKGNLIFQLLNSDKKVIIEKYIPLSSLSNNKYLNINFNKDIGVKKGNYYFEITTKNNNSPLFTAYKSNQLKYNTKLVNRTNPGSSVFYIGSVSNITLKELFSRINQFHPNFIKYIHLLITGIIFVFLSIFFILILIFNSNTLISVISLSIIFLLIVISKNFLWTGIFPMWQTPDEPAFYSYTQDIVINKKLPVVNIYSKNFNVYSPEVKNSYNKVFNRVRFHPNITENFNRIYYINELKKINNLKYNIKNQKSSENNYVEGNPPFYYFYEAIPYLLFSKNSIITRFFAMRIFSSLLSIVALFYVFLIFKKLFRNNYKLSFILTFITALQPMFSMISISITSQNMIDMFIPIFIYYLILFYEKLINNKNVGQVTLIIGIIVGLGLLTKAQMFAMLGLFLVVFAYYILKHNEYNIKLILRTLLLFFTPIFIIYGWWAYFSYVHYKTFYGTIGVIPTHPIKNLSIIGFIQSMFINPLIYKNIPSVVAKEFWADLGWLDTVFIQPIYYILAGIILISIIGIILLYTSTRKKKVLNNFIDMNIFNILFLSFMFISLLLLAIFYEYIKTVSLSGFLQGQYFLPVIVSILSIIFIGIYSILSSFKKFNNKKTFYATAYVFAISMLFFNLASIILILNRYYL
ncbi:MAG: ArnT family glycosyltransferase [Patescibacteria group bacterium]